MTGKSIMTTMDEMMTKIEARTRGIMGMTTVMTPTTRTMATTMTGTGSWMHTTSATMTTSMNGTTTMTESPAIKQIILINLKLREQIAFELANMNQSDLRGVLRMIRVWKGLKND